MCKQRGDVLVLFLLLLLLLLLLLIGCGLGIYATAEQREEFMRQCQDDGRKQYECTAMWRAGDGSTTVVPMPVPIR